jgi:hypothetical protein
VNIFIKSEKAVSEEALLEVMEGKKVAYDQLALLILYARG